MKVGDTDKNHSTEHLVERVEQVIAKRELAMPTTPVLLMVSGGSDSTALSYVASELREAGVLGEIALLHVNHKLRGQEADDDAHFVENLAALLDIPFFLCEIDIAYVAAQTGDNIEAVARRERYQAAYEALESMCVHTDNPPECGRIFTAHTADDRAESFYMRSIVGTGPGGFRAMRYRKDAVARPLLDESRESLREYINARACSEKPVARDANGALWREDATNAHTDRFRAYVRHEIVPRARQWNEHAIDSLTRSMNLIGDEDDMLEEMTSALIERSVRGIDADSEQNADMSAGFILLPDFGSEPRPLQRRVIYRLLQQMLGDEARVETPTIETVLDGFENERPRSGFVANIQGDLAVSANKQGVRVEPMAAFRARRKKA